MIMLPEFLCSSVTVGLCELKGLNLYFEMRKVLKTLKPFSSFKNFEFFSGFRESDKVYFVKNIL